MSDEFDNDKMEFEHIDADAVCESCGTVNPEETLFCRTCGNDLKEQRQRRISQNYGGDGGDRRRDQLRILTGLMTTLGLLIVVWVAMNLGTIESALVDMLSSSAGTGQIDVWSGDSGETIDKLALELEEFPSTLSSLEAAFRKPVDEEFYNGRYALVSAQSLSRSGILGEANLMRQGDQIFFAVKLLRSDSEIRGVATLTAREGEDPTPVARNTASIRIDGKEYSAYGFSERLEGGGHACYAQSAFNDASMDVLAYRVR